MKKLIWFTHTNISSKVRQELTFDLTEFLDVFIKNELWNKKPYRTEYKEKYTKQDLEKIVSIKMNIHTDIAPFSNFHRYEDVLNEYIDLKSFEHSKILSSGISEASKIAIIEVEFNSDNKVIDYLTNEEEKDIDTVYEKRLSDENQKSWFELKKIKSIISEFIQFYIFNLHLNFLTYNYQFSFSDKPDLIGFTTVSENENHYYETDKIDFFAHYFLYEKEQDKLLDLMRVTSEFWHIEIPSIHFFLDALKGNNVTSTNFLKLVFTIESFFSKGSSNDFMSLTIPLVLSKGINDSKSFKETLTKSFRKRNEIVHGNKLYDFYNYSDKESKELVTLFFNLKNIITHLFYFYINQNLYHSSHNEKINHEMIFRLFPNGINIKI
jgi:hypothetical protein